MNLAFLTTQSVAQAVIIVSLVAAVGLAVGQLRVRGVRLGIAGVLFSGLLFGHFDVTLNRELLEFLREFGLILFVYTIGVQVGPGFFSSLQRTGLRLNLLAALVVVAGVGLTVLISRLLHVDMAAAVGMYSGAVTNTPGLAAAQQALKDLGVAEDQVKLTGIGYAVAYPFGILGTILAMILTRVFFRVDVAAESKEEVREGAHGLTALNIKVENKNLDGLTIDRIPTLGSLGVRVSRVLHAGDVSVPQHDTVVRLGDTLLAVGAKDKLEELSLVVGGPSEVDLRSLPSKVQSRRIVVTHKDALGRTVGELDLESRYGVTITRASRADIEFVASSDLTLQLGDTVLAVGEEPALRRAAGLLGNAPSTLNHPQLIPVFLGIAAGVLLGNVPWTIPLVSTPVKLGLAGGPLVMALILSRVGQIGPLSWYMPISANFMLRELGIILFLSCVGLRAGDQFVAVITHGEGLRWMLYASIITFVPLMTVAVIARAKYKLNYMSLCGLLAGSMTDPPALSYANSLGPSSAVSIAYATVYPLVMLLRVVSAQLMALHFGI